MTPVEPAVESQARNTLSARWSEWDVSEGEDPASAGGTSRYRHYVGGLDRRRRLRQKAPAVVPDARGVVAAGVVDATLVGQTTAEEAVGEDGVVVGAQAHPAHVVAVRRRVDADVSRPATTPHRRPRRRHFRRWRQHQHERRQSQEAAQARQTVRHRHLQQHNRQLLVIIIIIINSAKEVMISTVFACLLAWLRKTTRPIIFHKIRWKCCIWATMEPTRFWW